ncbi:GntR family transcriptional regulator [Tropicibacter naphthalenivorans]|uniref:HTH-type transcriptional regulator McbR n=1 Tax=Tropicibacter naphthalenivorans TaxID=441103 RepID=A0A0P1GEM0_9RHOB|nr:GntR family transcriptional regulator [Tropicibacter naphthalenivorans]CUH79898.1 HTH-type transcriptional regulator McbR [Tropicibacter naphthalenivorans]SMC76032.1 transcriptional regulator, GntR family [Tropicibacter naphthalenivorans]
MNSQADLPAGGGAKAGLPAHERTYRALREAILFGALAPGEPVTIQGLTERLDTGMTPVREALRRLTAEGALQAMGNRRIVVPVLDQGAVDELTEARLALEPRLAARAAARANAQDVKALKAIDDRLDAAISRGDVAGYLRENHAFHTRLNAVADAPILTALVDTLWLRFGPSLRIVCGQVGTRNLPDLHKDLLIALQRRDIAGASAAISGDVTQGMDMIAQSL